MWTDGQTDGQMDAHINVIHVVMLVTHNQL